MTDDFPRRQNIYEMTPAERAIFDAVQAVEAVGADVRLTDAVILLQAARDSVGDFVDDIAEVRRQVITRSASPALVPEEPPKADIGAEPPRELLAKEQGEDTAVVNQITSIVRDADRAFEKGGGTSRHWVRDYFLPMMNARGFVIVDALRASLPVSGTEE